MRGLIDKQPMWHAGKVLGGTSMLNAMIYMRGHRADYNEWEKLGAEGWGYDDVLPYFKKSQGFRPEFAADIEYHGTKGPYKVIVLPFRPAQF
jgi:choline dehydrogenase-like flavoprotein